MPRTRVLREMRIPISGQLARVLLVVFLFNLGAAAWSAVMAGRLAQDGQSTTLLGTLYAVCDLIRLPATLLMPLAILRFGIRRVTILGAAAILLMPLLGMGGLGPPQMIRIMLVSALPAMVVYVGLPAFVIGAAGTQRDGWALACLGLVGGAGGALGPWLGGGLADKVGVEAALFLFAGGAMLVLPIAWRGVLPPPTPWEGWRGLGRGSFPWRALAALALASAADAGRAALVPTELIRQGQSLSSSGFLLAVGCAVAGTGFLAFGRLADRQSPGKVLAAGMVVLVLGSFSAAWLVSWASAFALSSAVLGMGASGIRLGAEVSLISWIGRDRAGAAMALGEITADSGRVVGAPTFGALGDARGGAYAFAAIGLAGLGLSAVLGILAASRLRQPDRADAAREALETAAAAAAT